MGINLSRINLNLLVALDILLEEQNVTRAGQRLFITQSAMSSILKQLRELFDDELFVRGQASRMFPTELALSLRRPLTEFLRSAEGIFESTQAFDPKTSQHTFRIGMSDYAEAVFLPPLLDYLAEHAPGLELDISHMNYLDHVGAFESGEVDLAIGLFEEVPNNLNQKVLFRDEMILVAKKNHPAFAEAISLEKYASLRQVIVVLFRDRSLHRTEKIMRDLGFRRNVVASVPHMLSAFYTINSSESELVCALPFRLVSSFLKSELFGLTSAPLPIEDSGFEIKQIWHARAQKSPAYEFLREAFSKVAQSFLS